MPLVNKANVLNDMKDGPRALEIGQKLVRQQPANAENHRIVASAYRNMGQLANAAARLDVALRLQPQMLDAWLDRASLASTLQSTDEAIEIIERGLKVLPEAQKLLESLAILLRRNGRREDTVALLRRLIDEGRAQPWTYLQLGRTLADFDREEADKLFRKAVELAPASEIGCRLTLAESLDRARYGDEGANIQEAYDTLRQAMTIGPIPAGDLHIARQIAIRVADYGLLSTLGTFEEFGRNLARSGLHGPLLNQLGRVETPEDRFEVLHQHRLWGEQAEAQAARNPIQRPPPRPRDGRIRLGFMSSDLRYHPVAYFALPLFQHVDRERFDVYCYSFYTGAEDGMQKFITSQVTAFRWVKSISNRNAAQMIADDQLDILFELGGFDPHEQAGRHGLQAGAAAGELAGLSPFGRAGDDRLPAGRPLHRAHRSAAPDREADGHAQELDLPRHGGVPRRPCDQSDHAGGAQRPHHLRHGQQPAQVRAGHAADLGEDRGGRSRFALPVRPPGGRRPQFLREPGPHLRRGGRGAGTGAVPGGARQAHALLQRDRHRPGHLPPDRRHHHLRDPVDGRAVVSLLGEAFFERLSYSILTNVGLGDLVATTREGYVETAVKLAADPARRMLLRVGLRDQVKASPLGQHEQFARDFYDLVAATVAAARLMALPPANLVVAIPTYGGGWRRSTRPPSCGCRPGCTTGACRCG